MGYTLILITSLSKWVDALVLLGAIYNTHGTACFIYVPITTYFSFDEISLKSDVKVAVIIFKCELGSFLFRRDIN